MARRSVDDWLLDLDARLHRFSGELSVSGPVPARQRGWTPRADVYATADGVVARFELAGVRPESLLITFDAERHCLIVRGERRDEAPNGGAAHRIEIDSGEFKREVELPERPLDVEKMRAQFRNGLLTVFLPEAADRPTTILIERRIIIRKG